MDPCDIFFYTRDTFFYGQGGGGISLRRQMTPRSFFDWGRYSLLHRLPIVIALSISPDGHFSCETEPASEKAQGQSTT